MHVILRNLTQLYRSFCAGEAITWSVPAIRYSEYTQWQKRILHKEYVETLIAYWKDVTRNLPLLELPTDHVRPSVKSYRGAARRFQLTIELSQALQRFSRQEGVTLFMLLLTTFKILLARYTGQSCIVVGSPITGRMHSRFEDLVGFCINILVLRTEFMWKQSFRQVLKYVKNTCLNAYAHSDLPYRKLVEEVHPERNLNYNPLFQVLFDMQYDPIEQLALPGLAHQEYPVETHTAKFDLALGIVQKHDRLAGVLEYSTDLFEEETMARMVDHLQVLLTSILAHPDQPVGLLPLLTDAEQRLLLHEKLLPHEGSEGDVFLHTFVERQARLAQDIIALEFEGSLLTYKELDQLAHFLRRYGIGREEHIGVCMERSLEVIITILAVLKLGAVYVPLDQSYPFSRLQFMVEDADIRIIINHYNPSLLEKVFEQKVTILQLERIWPSLAREASQAPLITIDGDMAAYIIYTSGSTGKPKGVVVTHKNIVSSTFARFHYYEQSISRFVLLASIAFDISMAGIFWTLGQGGTLVLPSADSEKDIVQLPAFIERQKISHLMVVSSFYSLLLRHAQQEELSSLQVVILGGDQCLHNKGLDKVSIIKQLCITEATFHTHMKNIKRKQDGIIKKRKEWCISS